MNVCILHVPQQYSEERDELTLRWSGDYPYSFKLAMDEKSFVFRCFYNLVRHSPSVALADGWNRHLISHFGFDCSASSMAQGELVESGAFYPVLVFQYLFFPVFRLQWLRNLSEELGDSFMICFALGLPKDRIELLKIC